MSKRQTRFFSSFQSYRPLIADSARRKSQLWLNCGLGGFEFSGTRRKRVSFGKAPRFEEKIIIRFRPFRVARLGHTGIGNWAWQDANSWWYEWICEHKDMTLLVIYIMSHSQNKFIQLFSSNLSSQFAQAGTYSSLPQPASAGDYWYRPPPRISSNWMETEPSSINVALP